MDRALIQRFREQGNEMLKTLAQIDRALEGEGLFKRNVSAEVREYAEAHGTFLVHDMDKDLAWRGKEKNARKVALFRLVEQGLLSCLDDGRRRYTWLGED